MNEFTRSITTSLPGRAVFERRRRDLNQPGAQPQEQSLRLPNRGLKVRSIAGAKRLGDSRPRVAIPSWMRETSSLQRAIPSRMRTIPSLRRVIPSQMRETPSQERRIAIRRRTPPFRLEEIPTGLRATASQKRSTSGSDLVSGPAAGHPPPASHCRIRRSGREERFPGRRIRSPRCERRFWTGKWISRTARGIFRAEKPLRSIPRPPNSPRKCLGSLRLADLCPPNEFGDQKIIRHNEKTTRLGQKTELAARKSGLGGRRTPGRAHGRPGLVETRDLVQDDDHSAGVLIHLASCLRHAAGTMDRLALCATGTRTGPRGHSAENRRMLRIEAQDKIRAVDAPGAIGVKRQEN